MFTAESGVTLRGITYWGIHQAEVRISLRVGRHLGECV